MSSPVENLFKSAVTQFARKVRASTYNSDTDRTVPGILINRDPPITVGWCGNDDCEHLTHKERRSAQKAADTRAAK